MAAFRYVVPAPPQFVPPPVSLDKLGHSDTGEFTELRAYIRPFVEGFAVTGRALSDLTSSRGLGHSSFLIPFLKSSLRHRDLALLQTVVGLGVDFSDYHVHCALAESYETFVHLWPILLKSRMDIDILFYDPTERGNTTLRKLAAQKFSQSGRVQAAPDLTTIAQLACDGDFYAVLNLIRRNVVPFSELLERYRGRNVLDWAMFYQHHLLAQELVARYPFLSGDSGPAMAAGFQGTGADGTKNLETTVENLQRDVTALGKENQLLKEQLIQMKEYMGMGV